ncbi:hypothetical protein [Magnetospirillum sp. UT-4]|uniref:hypothetical protein n=1 Tax=Magnetospirillum sp. UT-4 TaxID=2681467 RepID=UPI00137DD203|nr:hypothetical protein [Magnetospirillum sp. UT-4]CAA7619335.1 conserved hypothetical protein [Magnetospirillum sp. UT-4]
MKARSVVFTHIQWPFTVFGLPPRLMALSIAGGIAVYVLTIVFGAVALSVIAMTLVTILGLARAHRLGRSDRHIESVFLTTFAFWRFSHRRWLLTGAFPGKRSQGGRS